MKDEKTLSSLISNEVHIELFGETVAFNKMTEFELEERAAHIEAMQEDVSSNDLNDKSELDFLNALEMEFDKND